MMLWPRSLLWRTFLLLALLVVTATAGWFLIFRIYETEPRARAIAQNVVSIVNLTRAALITASPENRRALLLDLAQSEGIQIYPVEAAERLFPASDSELVQRVIDECKELGVRFPAYEALFGPGTLRLAEIIRQAVARECSRRAG